MLRSLVKSLKGRENGSSGGGRVEALAKGVLFVLGMKAGLDGGLTVVDDYAGDAKSFLDF
jgi:hypothetical protein